MNTDANRPTDAREHFTRANAFRQKGEYERALAALQCILQGPEDELERIDFYAGFAQPVHLFLGHTYTEMSDYDEAIASYSREIRLDGSNPHAYHARGNAYVSQDDIDKGIEDLDIAIRLASESSQNESDIPYFYYSRGYAYALKRESDSAIIDFDRAIELSKEASASDPKMPRYFRERGFAYAEKGNFEKAIQDYDRAIELSTDVGGPDTELSLHFEGRGRVYAQMRDFVRAVEDYDNAIRLDPTNPITYGLRAEAYEELGVADRADWDRQTFGRLLVD